jgi:hypothetical protein
MEFRWLESDQWAQSLLKESKEQGAGSHAFGGVRIGPKALEVGGAAFRLEGIN